MILLTFAKEPSKPILVMSGVFVALAIMLYGLREKPKESILEEEENGSGGFANPKQSHATG